MASALYLVPPPAQHVGEMAGYNPSMFLTPLGVAIVIGAIGMIAVPAWIGCYVAGKTGAVIGGALGAFMIWHAGMVFSTPPPATIPTTPPAGGA